MSRNSQTTQKDTVVYASKNSLVIDLMAASVIPLFYAFLNQKRHLSNFLQKHPERESINTYLKTCADLYTLLERRTDELKETYSQYVAERLALQKIVYEKIQDLQTSKKLNEAIYKKEKKKESHNYQPSNNNVLRKILPLKYL